MFQNPPVPIPPPPTFLKCPPPSTRRTRTHHIFLFCFVYAPKFVPRTPRLSFSSTLVALQCTFLMFYFDLLHFIFIKFPPFSFIVPACFLLFFFRSFFPLLFLIPPPKSTNAQYPLHLLFALWPAFSSSPSKDLQDTYGIYFSRSCVPDPPLQGGIPRYPNFQQGKYDFSTLVERVLSTVLNVGFFTLPPFSLVHPLDFSPSNPASAPYYVV